MQSIKPVRTNEEDLLAGSGEGKTQDPAANAIRALEDWELAVAGGGEDQPLWH